jgi:antitoxin (DNA-binding transcriptional repressor) of toxin-antitoxin stability system
MTIDIRDGQPQLSDLLDLMAAGDEVLIVEGDRQLARLVPVPQDKKERVPDLTPGAIWISDDFDDPLPDEFWLGSE